MPMAMNLSGSSKRRVGVFLLVVIFLSKICPPHTQSVFAVILQCFFFHMLALCTTGNGVCIHLLVLAQYCFFDASCLIITTSNVGGHTFVRKVPFAIISLKTWKTINTGPGTQGPNDPTTQGVKDPRTRDPMTGDLRT